jgi:hypothetical protein
MYHTTCSLCVRDRSERKHTNSSNLNDCWKIIGSEGRRLTIKYLYVIWKIKFIILGNCCERFFSILIQKKKKKKFFWLETKFKSVFGGIWKESLLWDSQGKKSLVNFLMFSLEFFFCLNGHKKWLIWYKMWDKIWFFFERKVTKVIW